MKILFYWTFSLHLAIHIRKRHFFGLTHYLMEKKNRISEPVFLMPVQCLLGIRSISFIHIKVVLYF